jgi:peroxiredoxin
MNELLKVGQTAPDSTLARSAPRSAGGMEETASLSDFRDKNIILVFYPADWSAVCGDELAVYNEMLPIFQKLNAEMLGISVDSAFCHQAFKDDRGFKMDLLADFEPKGAVAKQYGAYDQEHGFCDRALFVVDAEGVIRYSYVSPIDVNPGANEIIKTLKEIKSKKGES